MTRLCTSPDCARKHYAKGLCRAHYKVSLYGSTGGAGSNSVPCPSCGHTKAATKDSRPTKDGRIRRRQECCACGNAYTTYELLAGSMMEASDFSRIEWAAQAILKNASTILSQLKPIAEESVE